jgi:hypothetical protein
MTKVQDGSWVNWSGLATLLADLDALFAASVDRLLAARRFYAPIPLPGADDLPHSPEPGKAGTANY